MTADERESASQLLAQLQLAIEGEASRETNMERLALVAKMLLVYPGSDTSEQAAEARAGAYLDALSLIAPWCIAEAISQWHHGKCGTYNYQFAPAPAVLLAACEQIVQPYQNAIARLRVLMEARSLDECMDSRPFKPQLFSVLRRMP